jgi:hypothetical protein
LQFFHGAFEMLPADVGVMIVGDIDRADLVDVGQGRAVATSRAAPSVKKDLRMELSNVISAPPP